MEEKLKYTGIKNPYENACTQLKQLIEQAVQTATQAGTLKECELPNYAIERPVDAKNGDISCNIALCGAKAFKVAPRAIAEAISGNIQLAGSYFSHCEIAGPGFLNFFFADTFFTELLTVALCEENFGCSNVGNEQRVNVEFVSANPTGPMHMGNARGGALGASLYALLEKAGYNTSREFYINDAGNQIAKFGASLSARYLQLFDDNHPFPEDGYQGQDIKVLAYEFADKNGDILKNADEQARRDVLVAFAMPKNVADIKETLASYRIEFDIWFSEQSLYDEGAVQAALDRLRDNGYTYEQDGTLFFNFTKCGGEKDEVLIRQNGIPTYFAADIAYHLNKLETRGFERAIDIWGADHHGHIARLKAALTAAGCDGERLEVILVQLVRLMSGKEVVKMSKRSGKTITLKTLLQEVPIDAARFFFNMRESGTHLDFDLDLAVQTNSENPVYYVQYAHARICNMLLTLAENDVTLPSADQIDCSLLCHPSERALLLQIGTLPQLIENAALSLDVSLLPKYALGVAAGFHKFYTDCRIKGEEQKLAQNRLALAAATKNVLATVLDILAVCAPEKM